MNNLLTTLNLDLFLFYTGYQWSDGSNVDATRWAEGEPDNHRLLEQCVMATVFRYIKGKEKMRWIDKYCTTSHYFACQVPAGVYLTLQ